MKTSIWIKLLVMAILVFSIVPGCTTSPTSNPSTQPIAKSSTPSVTKTPTPSAANAPTRISKKLGDLGSIHYTLDAAKKASAIYDINAKNGTTLTVTDARKYAWMLWIPAGALLSNQKITMTAFDTIDASQSAARIRSGVQLEPDGLQFTDAAILTVRPPVENPGVGLIFSLHQDGSNVTFAFSNNSKRTAVAKIWHFSSAGYDDSADAGKDQMDQYERWAQEDYELAIGAANLFIKNGMPTPPAPPSISMFCRGTEVNPENGETYEYLQAFKEPYSDIVWVLLSTMKTLSLLNPNADICLGNEAVQKVLKMAHDSYVSLGKQVQDEKPPDRLFAVINAGLQIDRMLASTGANYGVDPHIPIWAGIVRDYYLDQIKTRHDYRAFPVVFTLNKDVQLLGGTDRLDDIMAAMTFEVTIDTSFDATWIYSDENKMSGHVEQQAVVKDISNQLEPPEYLWGKLNNLIFQYTTGSHTFNTQERSGTYPLNPGQSFKGNLYLKNWDACVTKTFDVMVSGFGDTETTSGPETWSVAVASGNVSFEKYMWNGGFMFTVPMQNLNPTLGDQSLSGTGSKVEDKFTSSAKIHIVINHTPK